VRGPPRPVLLVRAGGFIMDYTTLLASQNDLIKLLIGLFLFMVFSRGFRLYSLLIFVLPFSALDSEAFSIRCVGHTSVYSNNWSITQFSFDGFQTGRFYRIERRTSLIGGVTNSFFFSPTTSTVFKVQGCAPTLSISTNPAQWVPVAPLDPSNTNLYFHPGGVVTSFSESGFFIFKEMPSVIPEIQKSNDLKLCALGLFLFGVFCVRFL